MVRTPPDALERHRLSKQSTGFLSIPYEPTLEGFTVILLLIYRVFNKGRKAD